MNILVKDKLYLVQMGAIRAALKLELMGLKRSRSPSAYILAKRNYRLTGNREYVLEQLTKLIEDERDQQKRKYRNVEHIRSRVG